MKIMETSFKRPHARTAILSAPDAAAGHLWPIPLPETPGHSRASLGQSFVESLPLFPGSWCAQGSVCALPESVSPVLCKFWRLYGGVNGNLLQEAYATPRSAAPRTPVPVAGHCWPVPTQETLKTPKGRSGSVSVGCPGAHEVLFEPSKCLWWVWGLTLNVISPLLPSCRGFSFTLGCEVSFFGGIQHSPIHGCSATNFSFGVLAEEDERMSFYSAILGKLLKDWTAVSQMPPFLDKTGLLPHGGI